MDRPAPGRFRRFPRAALLLVALLAPGLAWSQIDLSTFKWKDKKLLCDNCDNSLKKVIEDFLKDKDIKLAKAYIVDVRLGSDKVAVDVSNAEEQEAKPCEGKVFTPQYPLQQGASLQMPYNLQTTQAWGEQKQMTAAFNANYFKFPRLGLRQHACGEFIGLSMANGVTYWPLEEKKLNEFVDNDTKLKTYALTFDTDKKVAIVGVTSFDQLKDVSYAVAGLPLFTPGGQDFRLGTNKDSEIARTAVGILDSKTNGIHDLRIVVWENTPRHMTEESDGITLNHLKGFMDKLGAKSAINLDGSGSASLYFNKDNQVIKSTSSDTEGPRPVINSFGFRLVDRFVPTCSFKGIQHRTKDTQGACALQ
ncbi:MAG: phosphodiester glycosidase family protein [Myxococcaceae bacterium]|nr:phosphodiester glycosidase family protein [Myxococcaceae bacterium]